VVVIVRKTLGYRCRHDGPWSARTAASSALTVLLSMSLAAGMSVGRRAAASGLVAHGIQVGVQVELVGLRMPGETARLRVAPALNIDYLVSRTRCSGSDESCEQSDTLSRGLGVLAGVGVKTGWARPSFYFEPNGSLGVGSAPFRSKGAGAPGGGGRYPTTLTPFWTIVSRSGYRVVARSGAGGFTTALRGAHAVLYNDYAGPESGLQRGVPTGPRAFVEVGWVSAGAEGSSVVGGVGVESTIPRSIDE